MSHIPYRTGLPTLFIIVKAVCNIITKYGDIMQSILTPEQFAYVEALQAACRAFELNVPNPRPGDE